jgi:hypothetical protein
MNSLFIFLSTWKVWGSITGGTCFGTTYRKERDGGKGMK